MSCRESSAGSALTTIARLESGLSDVQTLSAFHALRAEAHPDSAAPDRGVWEQFLAHQVRRVESNETFSDARRRSLLARLERARTGPVPDGRTYHAMRHIGARTARQSEAVTNRLESAAAGLGADVGAVRARYAQLQAETPRTRRGANPDGYMDAFGAAAAWADLPTDRGSVMALRALEVEALRARADRALSGPQRINRSRTGSTFGITEMGYDPVGGRLEIVTGISDQVHSYRGVPADVWARLNGSSSGQTAHQVWAESVRGQSQYRYATQEEADLDSAARQCADCGQFAASNHHCPPRIARETAARAAQEAAAQEAQAASAAPATATPAVVEPATERPPVRSARTLGMWGRGRNPFQSTSGNGRYDYIHMPLLTELRRNTQAGPVEFAVAYSGAWRNPGEDGLPVRNFHVRGTMVADRPGRGQYTMTGNTLRCDCAVYAENNDCPHINYVVSRTRQVFTPTAATTRADPAAAQAAAEAALRADWTRAQETAAEAARAWAPSAPEDTYSTNFAAFEQDMQAALDRKAAGEAPVPYMTENATGGLCTRESGRAFGVEIEFDFGPGVDRYTALAAIGRDLHAAGLTSSPQQRGYHAGMARGYTENHQGGWSFERDQTVSGEIVSPIMYDTPETWENLAKVCEIVKRHGGKATARTGSHVHVSTPQTTGATATELLRIANQHEDVMYRISQNPQTGQHRPMRWCGPNRDVAPTGYQSASDARREHNSHGLGVNLQSVGGGSSDHAEMRHWDGTLDPALIQAQVKVSAAMVAAAQRTGAAGGSPLREREPVGSHSRRMTALVGRSRRGLTSDELAADTATFRSFADTLFTRREDKAQLAALFAITKWQRPPRNS